MLETIAQRRADGRRRSFRATVGPAAPRRAFVAPERPLTLMDMLSRAQHPLLDDQARAEGVAEA